MTPMRTTQTATRNADDMSRSEMEFLFEPAQYSGVDGIDEISQIPPISLADFGKRGEFRQTSESTYQSLILAIISATCNQMEI